MTDHSKLSASSANRWIHCPGSVHMAEMFQATSSPAADEGSLAHAIAEARLNGITDLDELEGKVQAFYKAHPNLSGDFAEMTEYIDPYVDFVNGLYQETLRADSSAVMLTEQRLDFSEIVPGGFGTADVVIIGDGRVTVIDLKYGKGVPVSAKNNPQIRLYAFGAIGEYDIVYDFDRVKMVIYQPRLSQVTDEEMSVDDLKTWAENTVKPAAAAALSDHPAYCPGEWCTSHFCPGAGACRARAEHALAIERHSGKDPALLTDEEISDALTRADALQKWIKSLNKYALDEAIAGHAIPGWKVVEGKSVRTYSDEDKVADKAIKAGFDKALLYKSSLIGITEMEKLMGKKKFAEVLGNLIVKPTGAPKLAPDTDNRPAFDANRNIKDEFD